MNNDRLIGSAAASPYTMRTAMFRVIDRTQDDPEVQVQAMGLALYAVCDALDIDLRRLLTTCERMAVDLDGPFTSTFMALREYASQEIGRG